VRVPVPQEPTFAPAFIGSLPGNARPVRRSEQFPSCGGRRVWRTRSAGLCGTSRCFSTVCACKSRCALPASPALLGASARAAVLAGFGVIGVACSVLSQPSAAPPNMRSSSNRTSHSDAREASRLCPPSQPRAGGRERYAAITKED